MTTNRKRTGVRRLRLRAGNVIAPSLLQQLEPRRLFFSAPAGTLPQAYTPVDFHAYQIIANPVRNEAYISDETNHTLRIFDTDLAREVAAVPIIAGVEYPSVLAVSKDGNVLAVADYSRSALQLISLSSRKTIKQFDLAVPTRSIAFGVGNVLYATDWDNTIAVLSLDTGSRVSTIDYSLGGTDSGGGTIQIDRTGTRLYALSEHAIAEFDISTPNRLSSTPLRTFALDYANGYFVDRRANHFYYDSASIVSYDMNTRKSVTFSSKDVGDDPFQYLIDTEGMPSLYLRGNDSKELFEYRKSDGALIAHYHLGGTGTYGPYLVQTPNGRIVYTSNDTNSSAYGIGIIGSKTLSVARTHTTLRGHAFADTNVNGIQDADETGTMESVLYADLNNNGKRDQTDHGDKTDEPYTVIHSSNSIYDTGGFELELPGAGTYTLRVDHLDNTFGDGYPVATNPSALVVTIAKNELKTLDVGMKAAGIIEPTFFIDTNKNGIRDAGENPGGHPDLFLDLNRNGKFDAYEPIDRATSFGYYVRENGSYESPRFLALTGTYDLRMLPDTNSDITLPAITVNVKSAKTINPAIGVLPPRVLSGRLYHDLNANGVRDTYETAFEYVGIWLDLDGNGHRDAGEPSTHTKGNGSYTITTNHAAHNVAIRYITTDGKLTSTSTRRRVNLEGSAFYLRADAGVYLSARVALDVFADANKNGKRDKRERAFAGVIVYLDLDKDGRQDTNEPAVVTDATGRALFADLTPGQYRVTARISSKNMVTTATSFTLTAARDAIATAAVGVV